MARRIVVGTRNAKKLDELRHLLGDAGVEVLSVDEVCPGIESPEETGTTFEENARLKAIYFANACGEICVADDSGIELDWLDGAPGVYSARWAGTDGDDEANNKKLVESLEGVPEEERGAQYRCVIAVAALGEVIFVCDGICRGVIHEEPRGEGGFGYDPYFFFPDLDRTFAELSKDEKAAVSHRGAALARLMEYLPGLLTVLENRRNF